MNRWAVQNKSGMLVSYPVAVMALNTYGVNLGVKCEGNIATVSTKAKATTIIKALRAYRLPTDGAKAVRVEVVVRVFTRATGNYEVPPLGHLYKHGDDYVLRSTNDGIHGIPIRDGDTICPRIHPNNELCGESASPQE